MASSPLRVAATCLWLWAAVLLAPPAAAEALDAGQEGDLHVPGCDFPCKLYVPSDYRPGRRLPLILFMHGSGGKPTTWPWRTATDGQGHLIVGLSYGAFPDGGAGGIASDPNARRAMMAFIEQVRALMDETYGIDQKAVFLTGLSMGGWGTNHYGFHEEARGRYRGYAILAAGTTGGVDFSVTEGLPVLLLNGSADANLQAANRGKPLLEAAGALVEQVVLEGEPHVPSTASMKAPLAAWLAKIRKADERATAIAAVRWQDVGLAGPPPRTQEEVTAYVLGQPFLTAADPERPVLVFFVSRAEKKGRPTKAAKASAEVERTVFGYPAAFGPPSVARHFTCFRVDVSDLERKASPFLAESKAPRVLLVARDRKQAAWSEGSIRPALGEAMRAYLDAAALAAVDARLARIEPVLETLRDVWAKRQKTAKRVAKLRARAAGKRPSKQLAQAETALADLDREIDALRDQLADSP